MKIWTDQPGCRIQLQGGVADGVRFVHPSRHSDPPATVTRYTLDDGKAHVYRHVGDQDEYGVWIYRPAGEGPTPDGPNVTYLIDLKSTYPGHAEVAATFRRLQAAGIPTSGGLEVAVADILNRLEVTESPEELINGWIPSPEHYRNILPRKDYR